MFVKNLTNLNTSTNDDEIGGLKYLLIHLTEFIPYTILYIAGTIVGILGILHNNMCCQNLTK